MASLYRQYAVTAVAVDLGTAFGFVNEPLISSLAQLILTQEVTAVNPSFLGGANVTTAPANAGFVFPVVAANIPPFILNLQPGNDSRFDLREIYVIGTANAANRIYACIVY